MGKMEINCAQVGMIGTNCYLLNDSETKELIIVDPGDNADLIGNHIDRSGLKPVAILLTHAHFDHIGGVQSLKQRYNIPLYVHRLDVPMLKDPNLNMGGFRIELADDDVVLEGGEVLHLAGVDIKVIATPGHTPGGVCYYMESQGILLSGDTMFRFSWGRTDFPGGNAKDLMDSIREKLLPLPAETIVYPGHEGPTSIKNERITHDYRE